MTEPSKYDFEDNNKKSKNGISSPRNNSTLHRAVQFLLFVLFGGLATYVVLYAVYQTYIYHTAIPQWDEWGVLSNYQSFLDGKSSLIDFLWSLHNEHRVLVPKIIMIGDIELFNGAGILPKSVIFVAIALHVAIFLRLVGQYVEVSSLLKTLLCCGITIIFFSSQQLENFFRGFNHQVFLVTLFSTLSLYSFQRAKLAFESGKREIKGHSFVFTSVVFACLSTYSMAGGILTWPLLALYAWYMRVRRVLLFIIIFVGIACVATYLWQYSTPPQHSDPLKSIAHAPELIIFAMMFLGNIVGMFGPQASFITGLLGSLIFGLVVYGYIAQQKRIPDHSLLLILIASFTVLVSFLVALGRLKFGVDYGLSSRYSTFTSPFWASVIILAFSGPREFGLNAGLPKLLLTMLVVTLFSAILIRQNYMSGFAQQELMKYEKGGMALYSNAPDGEVLAGLSPTPSIVEGVSTLLSAKHLSPYTEKWLNLIDRAKKLLTQGKNKNGNWCKGYIDAMTPLHSTDGSKKWYRVEGWAWDNTTRRAPNLVLLVSAEIPSGIAKVFIARDDVRLSQANVTTRRVGWFGYTYQDVNEGVTAYAFSEDQSTLCKLGSSLSRN